MKIVTYLSTGKLAENLFMGTLSGINKLNYPFSGKFFLTQEPVGDVITKRILQIIREKFLIELHDQKLLFPSSIVDIRSEGKQKLDGWYTLYFLNEHRRFLFIEQLNLSADKAKIMSNQGLLTGQVDFFQSGNLAISIHRLNGDPFFSQLQFFPGRKSREDISMLQGIYTTLNEDMRPSAYKVLLIPQEAHETFTPEKIPLKFAEQSHSSFLQLLSE